MKIALLTISDDSFQAIAKRTFPSMRRYADAFGLEFITASPAQSDRPTSWAKIPRIREVLLSGYDYCICVDADTLFVRFDADIRNELVCEKDLWLCWHGPENAEPYVDLAGHYNAGVSIYRNCKWSMEFLNTLWSQTDFVDHPWWEQGALLHLLGHRKILGAPFDDINLDYAEHVQKLPVDWNAIVGAIDAPDPILRHFAGRPLSRRIEGIDLEIALQPLRETQTSGMRHLLAQQLNEMSFMLAEADRFAERLRIEIAQTEHERNVARERAQNLETTIAQVLASHEALLRSPRVLVRACLRAIRLKLLDPS